MDLSDEDIRNLFNRIPDGKEKVFEYLVKTYQKPIYWHIRRLVIAHEDADDVVQNVFIKIWTHLDDFKWESRIFTWIYRIATNESLNLIDKRKRRLTTVLDEALVRKESDFLPFTGDEIQLKLQRAILTLPDKQRIVFNMKYFDDKKYDEIAEILETSVGALKASYHHAVTKIRKYLEEN